jgi:hypothetical protein
MQIAAAAAAEPSNHQETFMLSQHDEKHDVSQGYVAEQ